MIQDGRQGGHLGWASAAIADGSVAGLFISAFHTPRVSIPRHKAAKDVVQTVHAAGKTVYFDPDTHAHLAAGTSDTPHYDTWQLWGPSGVGLDTPSRRLEHLERVFAHQTALGVTPLAATVSLDSPNSADANHALETAQLASRLDSDSCQRLVGTRTFWRSGTALDSYVGSLAALRSPRWVLTVNNLTVEDSIPDLADSSAFAGLCRTVDSLSRRSEVVVTHADYSALPAIAAGASVVGTGWTRAMRFYDPESYKVTPPVIRRSASYVTQGGLGAVLRRDAADTITRTIGTSEAQRIRGGQTPSDDAAERLHHFRQINGIVSRIVSHGTNRRDRVQELREFYEQASLDFNNINRLISGTVTADSRLRWVSQPLQALKAYAEPEGLWV